MKYSLIDDPPALSAFQAMTFPAYWRMLRAQETHPDLILTAAKCETDIIGLIIAKKNAPVSVELCSLFVLPPYRRQGIGKALLVHLEHRLQKTSCSTLSLSYSSALPNHNALSALLQCADFPAPEVSSILFRFDLQGKFLPVFQHRRFQRYRERSLPPGFTLQPWTIITEEQKKEIRSKENRLDWYEPWENPLTDEQRIDQEYSRLLLQEGKIIGWLVMHRVNADTLRYTHVFIYAPLKGSGIMMIPLIRSFFEMQQNNGPRHCWLGIREDNAPFLHLMKKRFADYAEAVDTSWQTKKIISLGQ